MQTHVESLDSKTDCVYQAIISHSLPGSLGTSYLPIAAFSQILHCSHSMPAYYFWMCHLSSWLLLLCYIFLTALSALKNSGLRCQKRRREKKRKNQRLHEEKFFFGCQKLLEYQPKFFFIFLIACELPFCFCQKWSKCALKV